PSFRSDEVSVIDLEVCKFATTVAMWNRILETDVDLPLKCPIVNITYYQALEFCNKLSEKYGLKPVYKLYGKYIMILEIDGEEVYPAEADFSKTEGFRLPTEVEWEWFARGGKVAQEEDTFNYKYSGSDNVNEVAVYYENTDKIKNVGTKKSNQLGLYDCSGNVWEWCYDTWGKNVYIENGFIYDESEGRRILRGGSWGDGAEFCEVSFRIKHYADNVDDFDGFRVVRTL
ncbi:MAG: formylglycine-generating enzyme family protein, partial [Streptobacillus sp.]